MSSFRIKIYQIWQVHEKNCGRTEFLGDFNSGLVLSDWLESCLVRFHKEQACSLDGGLSDFCLYLVIFTG